MNFSGYLNNIFGFMSDEEKFFTYFVIMNAVIFVISMMCCIYSLFFKKEG